jgi:hypothetical protein
MKRLGLSEQEWSQRFAMVPCISIMVDPAKADLFEARLQAMRVGDKRMIKGEREVGPMSYDRKGDSFQLFIYFEGNNEGKSCRIGDEVIPFEELGFGNHVHQDDIACSARHTPYGVLFVYDPQHPSTDQSRSRISTLDVAPAILNAFEAPIPAYMNEPDLGVLDTTTSGTGVHVPASGGGVEIPVVRFPQAHVSRESGPLATA